MKPTAIGRPLFETLAAIAAHESLPCFRQAISVENKALQGFDPVTLADKRTERALRLYLAETFPGYGILGEEEGAQGNGQEFVWVIDPIDGTRAFIAGLPVWGTLIGLLQNGRAIAGMMAQPFTQELFYTAGKGSFYQHSGGQPERLAVSKKTSLAQAILFSTDPALFDTRTAPAFNCLAAAVRLTRYGTDCYAFAMLAMGLVDLVVETGLKPYDIAALVPLIKQAGGIVTQWNRQAAEHGGNIIAAATPQLYEAALEKLHLISRE